MRKPVPDWLWGILPENKKDAVRNFEKAVKGLWAAQSVFIEAVGQCQVDSAIGKLIEAEKFFAEVIGQVRTKELERRESE